MADAQQTSLSLDVLKFWNIASLKDFCRRKGLKNSGKKEELIARVFAASEQGLEDVLSKDEEIKAKASRYITLLDTKHGRQPDPFVDLENGWISEERGRYIWPPTMYCDICTYFLSLSGDINRSISNKALNAYKEGKAFSYFDSGWLKEIFYHPLSDDSVYCFVKSMCSPSQKIGHVPHTIWIMLNKKNGEIQSAYCTCFAGLGSTCNHVAAVLFKMDFYWRQGLTNKACTDFNCSWNKYGADKTVLKPARVKEIVFRKPEFNKRNKSEHRGAKVDPAQNISSFSFKELEDALFECSHDAVVFQGRKQSSVSPQDVFEVEVTSLSRPPLCDLFKKATNRQDILSILGSFTSEDISNIEISTRGQSDNKLWSLHRVHRVTASIAHDVCSRMVTLKDCTSKRSKNPNPILKTINTVDKYDYRKVPALKYGIEMEEEARNMYIKLMSQNHKSFSVKEVGLMLMVENPQYGASPDGLVNCLCCESGLLEIKCPLNISHTSPTVENLACLTEIDSCVHLAHSNKYYSQVQWQMAICNKKWCDFFVYTRHGHYLERVLFNEAHFNRLMLNVNLFYNEFVIPDILSKQSSLEVDMDENFTAFNNNEIISSTAVNTTNCFISSSQSLPKPPKRRKVCKKSGQPVYLCEYCSNVCVSEEDICSESDQSVQCETCLLWFHFSCVNYNSLDNGASDWSCPSCCK